MYFQDVVYALAHATGKTGRFTLIERWRNNERLLAPQEHPLKVSQESWGLSFIWYSWCLICPAVCFVFMSWGGFLTARNCVVEENVWSSLHSWQLHSVTPPLNYCFVLHTYVFSSANRHFFQLNFVVNQIKVKDRSRNRVPVPKVSVLCEKVQEQFSN